MLLRVKLEVYFLSRYVPFVLYLAMNSASFSSVCVQLQRKTGNEPKVKAGTKRRRDDASETPTSSGGTSQVNPVLAGILYRSTSDQVLDHVQPSGGNQPQHTQQALARVAVGKGIRHGFTLPQTKNSSILPQEKTPRISNPSAAESPVEASLSALTNNFRNSLEGLTTPTDQDRSQDRAIARMAAYIPGSLSRDDSLVDLAMIPMVEEGDQSIPVPSTGPYTFVDFPWQDPSFEYNDPNQI
jgi:hypothetical protein